MMELKEFIKSTIKQIAESVEELNKEFEGKRVVVNPTSPNDIRDIPNISTRNRAYNVTNVDFDLSVSVESNEGSTGKVGVVASIVGLGVSSTEGHVQHSESKVRFTIPIMLPSKRHYDDNV